MTSKREDVTNAVNRIKSEIRIQTIDMDDEQKEGVLDGIEEHTTVLRDELYRDRIDKMICTNANE